MNVNVNQSNLKAFLPGKIGWMAQMYIDDHKCSIVDAVKAIYASHLYKQLEKEETKLWHLGPVALYEMLTQENNLQS